MKHRFTNRLIGLVIIGCAIALSGVGGPGAPDDSAERAAVLHVNTDFFDALNAMFNGDAEPFQELWWHTNDVVYMGADGAFSVGWLQTYENWKKQAAIGIGGSVSPSKIQLTMSGDMAMTNQLVSGVNDFHGTPIEVRLRSTSVFRKKGDTWKMICHHVDPIPDGQFEER